MKLHALRALLAAVETGSLRNAARRLGVSQPALTKAIRELEQELGAPLLLRSHTGVTTTAQGRVLADRARAAERELAAAVDQIRQLGGEMVGSLHIAAVPLALALLVPEALRTFSASHPGIRLRIDEELYMAQLSRLRAGEIDLAIGPVPAGLPAGELVIEPLMPIQMVVVAGKSSPHARARSLAELAQARWVFTGSSAQAGYARHLFAEHGLPVPAASAVVNSTLGLVALIAGGDFVGLMPRQIAAHPMAAAWMRLVPVREGALQANIAAMTRPESALLPTVRHFIAHLGRAAHHFGHLETLAP